MDESFAEHPETLGERRAANSTNGADWTPRDLLVRMLRDHDSGVRVLKNLATTWEDETGTTGFWNACENNIVACGLAAQLVGALTQG